MKRGKITKAQRRLGMKQAMSRCPEENQHRTLQRMNRMEPLNPRTHVSDMHIQRNDPCYCGSGKKFKDCHWYEQTAQQGKGMTPETLAYIKKQDTYFDKKMGRKKDDK